MKKFFREQGFLFILLGTVLLGYLHPRYGMYLKTSLDIKWFIMPTVFLMSFSLKTGAILRSFLNIRGLACSVVGGYVLTSLSLYALGRVVFPGHEDLALGLIAVGATPCTLASAAIWTRLSGGNDALALAITIVSNLSSFLFSPLILLVLLGSSVSPPFVQIMTKLLLVIVVPVTAGQVLRMRLGSLADRRKGLIGNMARGLILVVVLVSVSHASHTAREAGSEGGMSVVTLVLLILAVAAAHLFALCGCGLLARVLRSPAGDIVAVMFGGSQKTLPVGVFLTDMIVDSRPGEGLVFIALPILIYHATQLTLDSFAIGPCRKYIVGEETEAEEPTDLT